MDSTTILVLLILVVALLAVTFGIRIVPQSKVYVVERFGKFEKGFCIPASICWRRACSTSPTRCPSWRRQLPTSNLTVITRDNVQVSLDDLRLLPRRCGGDAVYRIENVDSAVHTTTAAIIRAACGELEFDDVQSRREFLNNKIKAELAEATRIWGIEITRTEVLDVIVDEVIRKQMPASKWRLTGSGGPSCSRPRATAPRSSLRRTPNTTGAEGGGGHARPGRRRCLRDADHRRGYRQQRSSCHRLRDQKRKVEAIHSLAASTQLPRFSCCERCDGCPGSLETLTELYDAEATGDELDRCVVPVLEFWAIAGLILVVADFLVGCSGNLIALGCACFLMSALAGSPKLTGILLVPSWKIAGRGICPHCLRSPFFLVRLPATPPLPIRDLNRY
jgi:hypothetical protein